MCCSCSTSMCMLYSTSTKRCCMGRQICCTQSFLLAQSAAARNCMQEKQRARQHSTSLITCCRFYIRTNAHTTWHAQMEVQLLHQERSTLDCGSRETACKGECMFCAQESTLYPLLWQTTGMPRDTCIQVKQQQTDTKPTCIPCIPPRPLALLMQAEGPAQRYS